MKINLTSAAILGLMLSINSVSQAQENTTNTSSVPAEEAATTTTTTNPQGQTVERVEVIGSRIKRIQKEGANPVSNVGKEGMKNSANTSTSDSLRDSSMASFGARRETSGSNAAAVTTIGLRGLGATRTLVLLNGRKLPKDPAAEAVDLNFIPQSAIERIEVLKDGASALYGTDALGGVVNIVTKKGYVGNEAAVKFSTMEKKGGSSYDVSLLSGFETENSNFMAVLSYNHQDKIFGKDRDLIADAVTFPGSPATYSTDNGTTYIAQPGCPADVLVTDSDGSYCYFKYNDFASLRPQVAQTNLFTDYTYRLGSGLKFYNRNIIVYKDIEWNLAPTPASYAVSGTTSVPAATNVFYRYTDYGNRDNKDKEFNYSALFGLTGNFSPIWEYDVSAGYSEVYRLSSSESGFFRKSVLQSLVANNQHDPLGAPGARGDVSSAIWKPYQESKTKLLSADFITTGELMDIENGPIGVAAGVSVFNEVLDQDADRPTVAQDVIGSSGSIDSGKRDVQSVFVEMSFPLTEKFEVDIAARADHYSDFGTAINPKLSAKYNVSSNVLIRSSVGTGFKAPSLSEVYGALSDGYITFIDRFACANNPNLCSARQWHVVSSGNRDLKEEKAFTANLGAVIQPTNDISFSVDGWYTKVNDIVALDYEAVTEAELKGLNLAQYGIQITRLPNGRIDVLNIKTLNLSSQELSGADLKLDAVLAHNVWGHQLDFANEFSYIFMDKYETFPGLGVRDTLGEWGKPRWRNTLQLSLKNDVTTYALTMRSIPGQNVQDRTIDEKISDMNEFDIAAAYKFSRNSEIGGGVKNVLNAIPPYDPADGLGDSNVVNPDLYDINGRKFFISYTQKF